MNSYLGDKLPMGELQKFVKRVEEESHPTGEAKPYIDQIKDILLSHGDLHSTEIK